MNNVRYSEVRCGLWSESLHVYFLFPSGLADKVQAMDEVKVKGFIIGPIHVSSADKPEDLNLTEISEEAGDATQFAKLIHAAHRRGELELTIL